MSVKPPADVDPADLFLTLIEPRPTRDLSFRLPELPDVVLGVRAIGAAAYERSVRAGASHLLAAVLTADGLPAFESATEAAFLDAEAQRDLLVEASDALDRVCPLYRRIDFPAWELALKRGAQALPSVTRGFVSCVDIIPTFGREPLKREHPERYWGIPPADLLDGHWLAFRAAVDVLYR